MNSHIIGVIPFQWFMEKLKGTYSGDILTKTNAESNHSISHEFEADSLSIVWLAKAGYHVNAETYVMEYLARLEKNNVARSPDKLKSNRRHIQNRLPALNKQIV